MQFCSLQYIICFLCLWLVHWAFCKTKTAQNILLLIASYVFYALWDWRCLFLLLLTSVLAYTAGRVIGNANDNYQGGGGKKISKWVVTVSITLCVSILAVFKYYNFFVTSFCDLFGIQDQITLNIILPVGISFYTFSAISYIVDVRQGKLQPVKDIVACLLYTSFFPAILSGPIHKATEQIPQYLKKREYDANQVFEGLKSFIWGAFMKLCVADRIGMYVDAVYGNISHHNGTSLLLAAVFYSLQIYADFAGYSCMAIGSGKMLGIRLQTNFVRPYFSKTITEFWSRWHMSLTSWFKNYVYIPLGGNRVNKVRWIINIMAVFLLSGLWHGAAYGFIIWGAMHGLIQVVEKMIYGSKIKDINKSTSVLNVVRIPLTFFLVTIAWIFFRLTATEATDVVSKIFSDPGKPFLDMHTLLFFAISFMIVLTKDIIDEWKPALAQKFGKQSWLEILGCVVLIAFTLLVGNLDSSSFIYFQF